MTTSITRVFVRVNRVAAIERGINGTATPVAIDLDVSQMSDDERREIAARYHVADRFFGHGVPDGQSTVLTMRDGVRWLKPITVCDPSQAGVLEVIAEERRAIDEQRTNRAAEQLDQAERWLRERPTVPREIIEYIGSDGEPCHWSGCWGSERAEVHSPAHITVDTPAAQAVLDSPEAVAWRHELDQVEVATRETLRSTLRRRWQELRIEVAAAERERADWIATHGSQRLQRLVAEGYEHGTVYDREREQWEQRQIDLRAADFIPGWVRVEADELSPPDNAPERALALLDAGRELYPQCRLARRGKQWVCVADIDGICYVWPRD